MRCYFEGNNNVAPGHTGSNIACSCKVVDKDLLSCGKFSLTQKPDGRQERLTPPTAPLRVYTSFFFVQLLHKNWCTCAKLLQLCPTLCDTMNCSRPGSSVYGILQVRILEWVAMLTFWGIFLTQGLNPCLLCQPTLAGWFLMLAPPGKPSKELSRALFLSTS